MVLVASCLSCGIWGKCCREENSASWCQEGPLCGEGISTEISGEAGGPTRPLLGSLFLPSAAPQPSVRRWTLGKVRKAPSLVRLFHHQGLLLRCFSPFAQMPLTGSSCAVWGTFVTLRHLTFPPMVNKDSGSGLPVLPHRSRWPLPFLTACLTFAAERGAEAGRLWAGAGFWHPSALLFG